MMRIYSKKQFFGILLLLCNKVKKYFCMAIMQRFQSVEIKFTSTVL